MTVLQTAIGGDPVVVALTLVGLVVTAVSSLVVAGVIARGYWHNRDPARLYLAVGLVLLTAGPIVSQLVLTNVESVSQLQSAAVANTSKLCGLGAIVYAIYVQPRRHGATLTIAVVLSDSQLMAAYSGIVGLCGLYVAWIAYRGYRRNESRPMGFLAVGLLLLTTSPVVIQYGLLWSSQATPAVILLLVTLSHLAGVLAILYALTRA